jgi:uncharacterized protein YkwD
MQTVTPPRRSRRVWRIIAPVVVAAAATTGCFGGAGGPSGDAAHLLQRVNAVRASSGLAPLAWCGTLANAAAAHTHDMASHGFMGHIGSDGSDMATRANRHGYVRWTRITENVAAGPGSVDAVMATWMGSSGHRAHILDRGVHHAGFARVGNYWTQMFGANGTC